MIFIKKKSSVSFSSIFSLCLTKGFRTLTISLSLLMKVFLRKVSIGKMFHSMSPEIAERMDYLETLNEKQRKEEMTRKQRLRQIPTETGKFLALLAASVPDGEYIEIGTSGGYSTLWLSLACRETSRKLTTFEILEEKATLARETFKAAGVNDVVTLVHGDARGYLNDLRNISFCFLDPEKEVYSDCYEAVVPNLVTGGLLVADNVISHKDILRPMIERALSDERVDALIIPIGTGELICRKR